MTSSEIAERKQVFDFADTNKDGKVSQDELKNLLVKFNEPIASPTVAEMIASKDLNLDGFIEFQELE